MVSSSSLSPSSFAIFSPSLKHYNRRPFQVIRAQSCRDGRSSNGVDANLRVLRERIEQVKMKEKLERCCRWEYGWNHGDGYSYNKVKRDKDKQELFELVSLVGTTVGFTCLTETLFLFLVSIFVHLHHSFY
ncbi:uncharacterized protein LOC120182960 [Hibiscus syriacus]|uniref:uncharacterized protein LOC120182960 n=1 Tax=Hibiscus syriacus TaxID=106335 RepID=UPI001920813E|nr:uncharacterized protein LOC120182960 [Hibiscus syriacus]